MNVTTPLNKQIDTENAGASDETITEAKKTIETMLQADSKIKGGKFRATWKAGHVGQAVRLELVN